LKDDNDFTPHDQMETSQLEVQITKSSIKGNDRSWNLKITNRTDQIAFFINP